MKRLLIISLLMVGCSKQPESTEKPEPKPEPKPAEKSTAQTAIDGFTGRTAVRAGQKAEKDLRAISAKKDEQLSEVLGE